MQRERTGPAGPRAEGTGRRAGIEFRSSPGHGVAGTTDLSFSEEEGCGGREVGYLFISTEDPLDEA